ncbi:hypothetical protein [Enterococcus sp. 5B3_DIV0040]|uniref:hypothetical protein n=1 Tax=Enterococcus sp. 5B3_DIV0040 TaxID=1834182 RepID=UPI000A331B21|nr:hypothetical protein [Enterococcus sp. 5B3_DIV0040]
MWAEVCFATMVFYIRTAGRVKEVILMKRNEPFQCSLCGWTDNRKKPYPYEDINEHFINAEAIWCPRNSCKERYERTIPKGYVCNWWYAYNGWYTLEKEPKILAIDFVRSLHKAKELRRIGLEIGRSDQKKKRQIRKE